MTYAESYISPKHDQHLEAKEEQRQKAMLASMTEAKIQQMLAGKPAPRKRVRVQA